MSDCNCGSGLWAIHEIYSNSPWVCEECFEEFLEEMFEDKKMSNKRQHNKKNSNRTSVKDRPFHSTIQSNYSKKRAIINPNQSKLL